MTSELKLILTPEFLRGLSRACVPLNKQQPVEDFGTVVKNCLFSQESSDGITKYLPQIHQCLKIISKFGLDNIPDWFDFLPEVDDVEFPEQALGLQLVLDQGPRQCLKGMDSRWMSGYFDEVAANFALRLKDLPHEKRPSSWGRWEDSVTFEYWLILRLFYGAPLVHNENLTKQAVAFTDETRTLIEERFEVRDPIRDQPEKRWALQGFPDALKSGGPRVPCDTPTGGFWLTMLNDVHKPILDKFGRYPYRNWVLDREMMPEEEEWLEKAEIFKKPSEDIIKQIKKDIASGTWSPIGDYSNEET